MTRTLAILPLLLLPIMAHAAPSQSLSFEHDGQRYSATVIQNGSAQLIDGTETSTGTRFHLRVIGLSVTGSYGNAAVDYRMTPATTGAVAKTASR